MKTKLFLFVVTLFVSVCLFAQEPDGLSCENAIPVDTSYVGSVPAAGTFYYSASTYDLPLTCYFYPDTPVEQAPKVYVDFTCKPGVYDDPNIVELIKAGSGWGIALPLILTFTDEYDKDYNKYYSLTIGEFYRELMAQYNITYNVEAIVKLEAPCAGEIRMAPDTTFKSCVENSVWLNLPDTVITGFQREADSYVLPFADWKNDSIQFRWTGNTPVTVWIGETCDFEFKTSGSNCALDMFELNPDAGNGENIRVFTKQDIADYISAFGVGGVYYLRTVCAEDGELIVEKKPVSEEMQKAQALALEQSTTVAANNVEQVYYFPKEWENNNIVWTSSSDYQVTAYFSSNVTFAADENDPYVCAVYKFTPAAEGRELALSKKQMKAICDNVTGDNVFVKFVAAQKTIITPVLWSAGPCVESADEIYVNDSVRLQRNASSTAWRINIAQWAEQDVKLYWKGTSSIKMFLCDTCKGFTLNKSNAHVKLYKEVTINNDGSRDTVLLTKDELSAVAQYADSDGYLYFRFNNSAAGALITKADVYEPEPPVLTPIYTNESATLCYGESMNWNGKVLTETGEYIYTTLAANGADSIVTITLTVYPQTPSTTEKVTIEYGATYEWYGVDYNETGTYVRDLQDENGCDYQTTLVLTVKEKPILTTALVFDESINLEADNVDNTYYITRDWANLNIEFVTNSPDSVYAYFATAAEFDLDSQDPNFLAVYPFYRENGQSSLQLSAKQLNGLLDATSDTLFVVFHAFYNTQLTTYKWNACACVENSLELRPNDQHALIAYATNTVFRVKYSQWQDRDVTLLWNSNINLKAYLADTCDFKLTYSNKHVLNKKNYEIAANSSISIGKDVRTEAIDKGRLPDNGFLYFRFVSTEAGLLTTSFIQNGSGSTTDVEDLTIQSTHQLFIAPDGRMYLYVDGKRYNILGQVVD